MAADLAAADQQRRELIANVSHELRTPIAALQAVLENLVDGVATADPATLSTALAQTQRLGRLVAELLDLSRIDAGAVALDLEPVPVAELVGRDGGGGRGRGARRRLAGWGSPSTSAPRLVARVDRNRVHQVLVNLLDNAARHSPPGGVVSVSRTRVRGHGWSWRSATRVRASRPRTATGCSTASRGGDRAVGGGTGLGLAIARWAVDLHGGEIVVAEPVAGRGCRIQITLPGVVA